MIEIPAPPIRHQQLILTIYGLYGREGTGALPVSTLIQLLGDLGHEAPGVRSAVSRMKSKGVLTSEKQGGAATYSLSAGTLEIIEEGDARIFAPYRASTHGQWVLAIFSVPESKRDRRHQLRTELTRLGFGAMASGTWIAPANVLPGAKRRLEARGLTEYVEFFTGAYDGEELAAGRMREKVSEWWDLETLSGQVDEFMEYYGSGLADWRALLEQPSGASAEETGLLRRAAFRYYIPMLTLWRRLPYRDPGLPLEYLPSGWRGPQAREIFFGVHDLISPLASEHAHTLLE
ncbi:PaaX family transcriptional regulator [Zhihengliuella salsuginis]|uniref:PaaX family transcriptional regulator n=1 Tax=Zhihengliuella salsuginis TaxID=578222 RepID=A0ABQ3GIJ1_9MICC|nr:PaaX family transcriptional regulator C-terminal domain-containing protein [Zhihengliuella salsuginis]GHD07946.1 PaaX family transcriptional regulator [Zhihengliuella salsuginis]